MTAIAVAAMAAVGLVGTSASAGAQPFGYVIVEGLDGCTLHRIDLATGVLDPAIGPESTDACVNDLAFAPDGSTLYGMDEAATNVELVRFDLATGAVTVVGQVGTFPAGGPGGGLAFDAAGVLYLTTIPEDPDATTAPCRDGETYCTYRVDPANPGAALFVGQTSEVSPTVVGPLAGACDGGFVGSQDLLVDGDAFDDGDAQAGDGPDGTTTTSDPTTVDDELAESAGLGQFALTNVNRGNGLGTVVDQPFGDNVTGFDFDRSGTLWGVGTPDLDAFNVYTINRSTGVATATVPITPLGENAFVLALAIPTVCLPELTFTG
jgi:hypothetical protein